MTISYELVRNFIQIHTKLPPPKIVTFFLIMIFRKNKHEDPPLNIIIKRVYVDHTNEIVQINIKKLLK